MDPTDITIACSASSRENGADHGLGGPSVVLITGSEKPFRTKLSDRDYDKVLSLVNEFRSADPRSVLP
ncbi:MAG TPA: hypothetical protein VI356_25030 [Myxococcales bacterium]